MEEYEESAEELYARAAEIAQDAELLSISFRGFDDSIIQQAVQDQTIPMSANAYSKCIN